MDMCSSINSPPLNTLADGVGNGLRRVLVRQVLALTRTRASRGVLELARVGELLGVGGRRGSEGGVPGEGGHALGGAGVVVQLQGLGLVAGRLAGDEERRVLFTALGDVDIVEVDDVFKVEEDRLACKDLAFGSAGLEVIIGVEGLSCCRSGEEDGLGEDVGEQHCEFCL